MRYVVLDTDVASRIIKRQLDAPLAARRTAIAWCVTFVTVGELWQWATMRTWGRRTREELEDWLSGVIKLDSDPVISRSVLAVGARPGNRQVVRRVAPRRRRPAARLAALTSPEESPPAGRRFPQRSGDAASHS